MEAETGLIASTSGRDEAPVPPQYTQPVVYDFRCMPTTGLVGYKKKNKRKLDEYEEQVRRDEAEMDMEAPAAVAAVRSKKLKLNTVGVGKASGRPWKGSGLPSCALRPAELQTSWDKKMADKAAAAAFKAGRAEAVATRKAKLQEARRRREAAKQRKEENQRKSAVVQKITNPATLKRMLKSKKQRKKIMAADTL